MLKIHAISSELTALSRAAGLMRSDAFLQHGQTSVLLHSVAVAYVAMTLLELAHVRYDRRALCRGALLHDFFLYDWHTRVRAPGEAPHGWTHPATALRNARARIDVTPREADIILHHMFPLTVAPPRSREALAVCAADKCCAAYETVFRRGGYPALRRIYARRFKQLRLTNR